MLAVILHDIERSEKEAGSFFVFVSTESKSPSRYQVSYDDSSEQGRFCILDSDLFMELSDIAHKEFGDCTIYQIELMLILGAYANEELQLDLPVKLGTTQYCLSKPGPMKIVRNKLSFLFIRVKWKLGMGRPARIPRTVVGNERQQP